MRKEFKQLMLLVLMGLFIALSVIGAIIKIPSPTGTVALDSMPGYLAALLLGGIPGAVVAFLGHMATAASTGFPMTLPIHLLVACEMAVIMLVVGYTAKKLHLIAGLILGLILNGVVSPASFILFPQFGTAFFISMVLPLTVGSLINIIPAGLVYYPLRKINAIEQLRITKNGL